MGGEILEDGGGGWRLGCIAGWVDKVNARYLPVNSLQPRGHPGAYLHIVHFWVLVGKRATDRGFLHSTGVEFADEILGKGNLLSQAPHACSSHARLGLSYVAIDR